MAGVWGRPVHAEAEVEQDILDSDFACSICFTKPQSVRFRPCKHAACKTCVDSLRRTNIFKVCNCNSITSILSDLPQPTFKFPLQADAGVKCPYCRGYVEGYEPLEK